MTQDIQFQQVMIDGMVVEMCCRDPAFHIVGRMLHRREFIDVVSVRKDDNTAGMLSGTPPDPGTPFCDLSISQRRFL